MIIKNNSGAALSVCGQTIEKESKIEVIEHIFDTICVFSDIGSVEITCEYGNRIFRSFGNLCAYEEDLEGQPIVVVSKNEV